MAKRWKFRFLTFAVVAFAAMGCNPLTMPFFMMYGAQSKQFAEYPLVTSEVREPTVLILTTFKGYVREDFVGVERTLTNMFAQKLSESCLSNEEKVTVIPVAKVERYKADNPRWQTQHPATIGEHFKADYVIDLTITSMSIFDRGTRELYSGRADISVEAYSVSQGDAQPTFTSEYSLEYPPWGRSIEVTEMPTSKFKLAFFKRITTDLAWKFTDHLVEETYGRSEF